MSSGPGQTWGGATVKMTRHLALLATLARSLALVAPVLAQDGKLKIGAVNPYSGPLTIWR